MPAAARAIESRDLPALAEFLIRIYGFAPGDHHADVKLLEWKYLLPRAAWQGSRSYILEKNGRIAAHCGICPVTFELPNGTVLKAITVMDWAADPGVPGAGVSLMLELMAMAPASFIIGGAPVTRQIAPRMGFKQTGEAQTYSGWLRPGREFFSRSVTRKSFLRLLHGWTHPVRRWARFAGDWKSVPVAEFDDSVQPVLNGEKHPWTVCKRTPADLNYFLQCPHLKTTGLLLRRGGRVAGYCIVGRSEWETRVLDVGINSNEADDWNGAWSAITRAIRLDTKACRIRVQATVPVQVQALLANGYWPQYAEPIFIYDRTKTLAQIPAAFQLCDGDAGY
jgi:hypothetical protein